MGAVLGFGGINVGTSSPWVVDAGLESPAVPTGFMAVLDTDELIDGLPKKLDCNDGPVRVVPP